MGCATCGGGCSTGIDTQQVPGCGSKGSCSCSKLNTFDWLSDIDLPDSEEFDIIEVSFKNGSRKGFYFNQPFTKAHTSDMVVVEAGVGYDIGRVTLSGELVRLQMKKKGVDPHQVFPSVIRRANERDVERLRDARMYERETMLRARVIARSLGLIMKIGDVEYQGDRRKATFYYTADGRVDFRELIKIYAKEFRVKIEMRQIGARQESARIGGLGSCGRELCCSTWLTDFKSVSTAAARYQNLAINQSKLSGQCGRLKCCLNYELDSYMEAVSAFPKKADTLHTQAGVATLIKTDIFKGLMYYMYKERRSSKIYPLEIKRVKYILDANAQGKKPLELVPSRLELDLEDGAMDYTDVTGSIELPNLKKQRKKRKNRKDANKSVGNNKRTKNSNSKSTDVNQTSKASPKPKNQESRRKDSRTNNKQSAKHQGSQKANKYQDTKRKDGRNTTKPPQEQRSKDSQPPNKQQSKRRNHNSNRQDAKRKDGRNANKQQQTSKQKEHRNAKQQDAKRKDSRNANKQQAPKRKNHRNADNKQQESNRKDSRRNNNRQRDSKGGTNKPNNQGKNNQSQQETNKKPPNKKS